MSRERSGNNSALHVRTIQSGQNRNRTNTVILIPGLGGQALALLALTRHLSQHDIDAVVFDLDCSYPVCAGQDITMSSLASQHISVLTREQATCPTLIGYCFGAHIALAMARHLVDTRSLRLILIVQAEPDIPPLPERWQRTLDEYVCRTRRRTLASSELGLFRILGLTRETPPAFLARVLGVCWLQTLAWQRRRQTRTPALDVELIVTASSELLPVNADLPLKWRAEAGGRLTGVHHLMTDRAHTTWLHDPNVGRLARALAHAVWQTDPANYVVPGSDA